MASELPGWVWNGERLVADDTPQGAWARGMVIKGECRLHPECTRRVTIDCCALINQGYGQTTLFEIEHRYECDRIPHCRMAWAHLYPHGVPLQAYVSEQGLKIRITCSACSAYRDADPSKLIGGLERRRRGDGNTGLFKLAEALQAPCRCGGRRWAVRVERKRRPQTA